MSGVQTAEPGAPVAAPDASGSTLPHVMRSEWTKLFSVRSTGWTLLALIAATVGLGILASWGTNHAWSQMGAGDRASFDPTGTSLSGLALGQLAIAVLGVLIVSGEYSTGGIRTTLTTVPQRMRLLTAKALVFAAVALVAGWVASFAAFFAVQPWFSKRGIGANTSAAIPNSILRLIRVSPGRQRSQYAASRSRRQRWIV